MESAGEHPINSCGSPLRRIVVLSVVVPELKFRDVEREVLAADLVIDALPQGGDGFLFVERAS